MIAVLVSYTIGSLLGFFWGWSNGVKKGSAAIMKILVENEFLNTHIVDDQMVILPHDATAEQDQIHDD